MGGRKKATETQKPEARKAVVVFGEIIREKRHERNLSQRDLAAQTDLERSTIAYLELGTRQPSLTTIIELSMALGMLPSEVLKELEQRISLKR